MTITEIENILQTLRTRHLNLDEQTLTTLLIAGGWEEKVRQDALTLFKSSQGSVKKDTTVSSREKENKTHYKSSLPVIEEEGVVSIPLQVVNQNNLVTTEEKVIPQKIVEVQEVQEKKPPLEVATQQKKEKELQQEIVVPRQSDILVPLESSENKIEDKKENTEPQSLVVEEKIVVSKQVEPPSNLPTRPFESTDKVWDFGMYKKTFHHDGEDGGVSVFPPAQVLHKEIVQEEVKKESPPIIELKQQVGSPPHVNLPLLQVEDEPKRDSFSKTKLNVEDEKLVVTTGMMLLFILLLLVYMYTNGRL